MIQHIVMMKFHPEVGAAEIDALEAAMDALPNKITEIFTYEFGRDVIRSERSCDFALVSTFANLATLKAYQTHPEHLKLLAMLKPMCTSILVVDFEAKEGATRGAEPPPVL
jgi:hypothetical protein